MKIYLSIFQAKGIDNDVQTMYGKWREYIISILKKQLSLENKGIANQIHIS